MRFYRYILMSLVLAAINTAAAQDSLVSDKILYQLERSSLFNELRIKGTAHAALRQYRYRYSGTDVTVGYEDQNQDRYNLQRGSGESTFTVSAKSFLREFFSNTTVWGTADYTSSKIKSVSFNESIDYARIFPYFLADSVGGDINLERYRFGGGLVRSFGKWNFGGEINIDAKQSYRRVDPRPNNKSTTLGLNLSLSHPISKHYLLSASVEGDIFREQDVLNFVGKLGQPSVINLNGLGAYNNLLRGTATGSKANFLSKQFTASFQLMPTDSGLWMSISGTQESGDKTIPQSFESINNWEDKSGKVTAGYNGQWNKLRYTAMVDWSIQQRKGREGIFSIYSEDISLLKISEKSSYRYYNDAYSASIALEFNKWNLRIHGAYNELLEQYASPFRMQQIQQFRTGIDLQYTQILGTHSLQFTVNTLKTATLSADHKFNGLMESGGGWMLLNNNFDYLRSEPFYVSPSVHWSLPKINELDLYIAAHGYYATDINQKGLGAKIGLVF